MHAVLLERELQRWNGLLNSQACMKNETLLQKTYFKGGKLRTHIQSHNLNSKRNLDENQNWRAEETYWGVPLTSDRVFSCVCVSVTEMIGETLMVSKCSKTMRVRFVSWALLADLTGLWRTLEGTWWSFFFFFQTRRGRWVLVKESKNHGSSEPPDWEGIFF